MTTATEIPELKETATILGPLDKWAKNCHGAAIKVVNEASFECRVARGLAWGVVGQHSWVILGNDCYDKDATIIDPTLWSYDSAVEGIWTGTMREKKHEPHGAGSIWDYGKPVAGGGEIVELEPREPFSEQAQLFLRLLGPMDRDGWMRVANAPVEMWPAAEIMLAIHDSVSEAIVPIDIIGMLTDRNPGGLYLPGEEK